MTSLSPHIFRRIGCGKYKFLALMVTSLTLIYGIVFVIPLRNVIFHSSVEYAWINIPTSDLIRIHYSKPDIPEGILLHAFCPASHKPHITQDDSNTSNIRNYHYLLTPEFKRRVLENGQGRFLPALNLSEKVHILYLYTVLSQALDSVSVKHFLVDGSLLGLHRHGGIVPWDDDLDISVSLDAWELVQQTLACVQGFTLNKRRDFHWKFHYNTGYYPFVDIFFYRMDESYVWAASKLARKTFIYPTRLVFPLGESTFEGMKVPVPNDSLSIAKRIYEYDMCDAYSLHMERNMSSLDNDSKGYLITSLSCKKLAYMYPFF